MTGGKLHHNSVEGILHSVYIVIHAIIPYDAAGYFGQFKMVQKTGKITETLAHGYLYESEGYPMRTNMTGFRIFVSLCFG